jgi:hypothetical protein
MDFYMTGWGSKKPTYPITTKGRQRFKICLKCLTEKPLEKNFTKKNSWSPHYNPYCKDCKKQMYFNSRLAKTQ